MQDNPLLEEFAFPTILRIKKDALRLIDTGILPNLASKKGFKERYISGKTSHTVHVWWARRPHITMRLLSYASLCKSVNEEAKMYFHKLAQEQYPLTTIAEYIKQKYSKTPKLIDLFGGGGTIAIESSNLGASAYSIDSNELSVFIQKSHFEFMQNEQNRDRLINLIKISGKKILTKMKDQSDKLFPNRNLIQEEFYPVAYLWTYQNTCDKCGFRYFLSKRPFLDKKSKSVLALSIARKHDAQTFEFINLQKDITKDYSKNYRNSSVIVTKKCPKCFSPQNGFNIKNAQDYPVAIICKSKHIKGKRVIEGNDDYFPSSSYLINAEKLLDDKINFQDLIEQKIPVWNGVTNLTLYGIEDYKSVFNDRQRVLIKLLVVLLHEEYLAIKNEYSSTLANIVIAPLSALIDQLVDWNSRITMWISENMQPGRAFSGPGVPMFWDYCEVDPLLDGPANLWDKLNRIVKGLESLPMINSKIVVKNVAAQDLPFDSKLFDAVVTDPPYYDNLYYTILADFFYVWKYPLIKIINPKLYSKTRTNDKKELTASVKRYGVNSHSIYSNQLLLAIKETERIMKDDGVLSFIYSHSSFLGWDALLYSFQLSDLFISSVQPLNIERKQRPRSMNSNSIDVCMTFVARKISQISENDFFDQVNQIPDLFSKIKENLEKLEWHKNEIALSLFANGIGILCNLKKEFTKIERKTMILDVESQVKLFYPNFKLKMRKSL